MVDFIVIVSRLHVGVTQKVKAPAAKYDCSNLRSNMDLALVS